MALSPCLATGNLGRWLVALILAIPTVICIFLPNKVYLLVLVCVFGGIAWHEFVANLLGRQRIGLLILTELGWVATAVLSCFFGVEGLAMGLFLAFAIGAAYLLFTFPQVPDKVSLNLISRYALGHLYISFSLSFVLLIKPMLGGPVLLFFVILVTALSDTGAIYVGSRLKGPKLFPKASPNKTISGFLGGIALAMLGGALSSFYLPKDFTLPELVVMGLVLAVTGTFGDLFESALKRTLGIKDTSTILLGHGGFWDRLDSLLFNLPIFYFYISMKFQP
ncbi:MAG: phosphatidate cytidylyltransferase [Deltaproteobacteria bacterium]|jgi:phosphatidate cytidylyltransferase|nr:phosphatidate cytidylyltransferase [Deltaproteobacteria bacterium]